MLNWGGAAGSNPHPTGLMRHHIFSLDCSKPLSLRSVITVRYYTESSCSSRRLLACDTPRRIEVRKLPVAIGYPVDLSHHQQAQMSCLDESGQFSHLDTIGLALSTLYLYNKLYVWRFPSQERHHPSLIGSLWFGDTIQTWGYLSEGLKVYVWFWVCWQCALSNVICFPTLGDALRRGIWNSIPLSTWYIKCQIVNRALPPPPPSE